MKVLVSDKLSPAAVDIFTNCGIEVDFQPDLGKDKPALLEAIPAYDGLAVRSATKVTDKVIAAADNLKVIGRAGIGVDNIDIAAATARGIIVMNTPFGNAITTAEHAMAMMFALARRIPAADVSTKAGRWEKSKFTGIELTDKTLGLIGCGNIGSIVAARALGLKMKVIAYDPFLSPERAADLGVRKVELAQLLSEADIVSLHTPLTEQTRNIIDANAIAMMRDGAYLINCARGGLVVEADLRTALERGKLSGAAVDVFSKEPAHENILFAAPNIICTPHLGAATTEAQENVALQVARQMADYLASGAISNAINSPSISATEAPKLAPFVKLADQLGSFAGQLTGSGLTGVTLEYEGAVAGMNTKALTAAALTGLMRPIMQSVNMVSAPVMARERGIAVEQTTREQRGAYESYIRLGVSTERQTRSVAGTVFADRKPRIIQIKGINLEAELGPHMLYVTNNDKPGFIGQLGTLLGQNDVNIATFHLGRDKQGGQAIALVEIDNRLDESLVSQIAAFEQVTQAAALQF